MRIKPGFRRLAVPLLSLALSGAALCGSSSVQDEAQDQRDIQAKEALQGRPPAKGQGSQGDEWYRVQQPSPERQTVARAKPKRKGPPVRPMSQVVTQRFPMGTPPAGKIYLTLGVTLWRVREATQVERQDATVATQRMTWNQLVREVLVSRATDDIPVKSGDLIQMSLEYLPDADKKANRAAYIYVINCEQMPDDSWQNAKLIFPTKRTYKGDSRLLPGQTVTLPDPHRPFIITRSNSVSPQQYETYLIIVSPVPLDDLLPRKIDDRAMELSAEFALQWWQDWGEGNVRADLRGRLGQARTQRELGASGNIDEVRGTQDTDEGLTQADPPPQTVFRRVVEPGETMLVTIRLPFREVATRP